MSSDIPDDPTNREDMTLSSAAQRKAKTKPIEAPPLSDSQQMQASRLPANAPWLLRRFYEEQIDLAAELASRFASLPLMTVMRFRTLDAQTGRGMVTMSTADGLASVLIESDPASRFAHMAFSYGSMLTLRFYLDNLSQMDRAHWLEQMRRQQDTVTFLWGQARWEHDYIICSTRQKFVNLYAFSHNGFEAAVRLTPDAKTQLLNWLDDTWKSDADPSEDTGKLLTW
jgi:hypothetical protein